MDWTEFTLIVPTKNEADNILSFLAAVPETVQVIIVDASSDGTGEIVRQSGRERTVVLQDSGNIATARQLAAEKARTDWLLYSDADVLFSEDYFETLAGITPDPCYGGIVGVKRSRDRYRSYYFLFSLWLGTICAAGIPAASGSNMLVRRQALLEAGGFDRRLSCNEDSELMWRIHRQGYKVAYAGGLKVYEFDHRRLDEGVLRKTFHSLARCALLYSGLMQRTLRAYDWGYWRSRFYRKSAGGQRG